MLHLSTSSDPGDPVGPVDPVGPGDSGCGYAGYVGNQAESKDGNLIFSDYFRRSIVQWCSMVYSLIMPNNAQYA